MAEAILYIIFTTQCVYISYIFDISKSKLLFLFSVPAFIILGLFPLHHAMGLGGNWVTNSEYFELSWRSWLWLLVIMTSLPITFIITSTIRSQHLKDVKFSIDNQRLLMAYQLLTWISIGAALINLSRVGFSISLLFTNPREYEMIFGQYWQINYLYFLHVPALCLLVIMHSKGIAATVHFMTGSLLLALSLLHGIKFTLFDAIFFPVLTGLILGVFSGRTLYLASALFLVFFTYFSYFVRGSYGGLDPLVFLEYVLPNYYNFFYLIEQNPFPATFPLKMISSYIPSPVETNTFQMGFILNDKFNVITGFGRLVGYFSFMSVVLFYGLMFVAYNKLRGVFLSSLFLKTYILFCILMMFYNYYLGSKPKYIFIIIVFILLDIFIKAKYANNHSDSKLHNNPSPL